MTVEALSEERVLISLLDEDLKNLKLKREELDIKDERTKRALYYLLLLACSGAGIAIKGKSFLIEALPSVSGCLLLVSAKQVKKRKRYRIKRDLKYPCFIFENVSDLLDGMERMGESQPYYFQNSVFESGGRYFLVFEYPTLTEKTKSCLLEFSTRRDISKIALARLKESARLIASGNAVAKLSRQDG